MTVGAVMLAHGDVRRALQVTGHLAQQGMPVALHIDRATVVPAHMLRAVENMPHVVLIARKRTPWGAWPLVDAAMRGARQLLDTYPHLDHIVHLSGSCIPVQPVSALEAYLGQHEGRDFIQSVRAGAVQWVAGGLQRERFTYHFPFDFQAQRRLFDLSVRLQRKMPEDWLRRIPPGIDLYMGSQWWCLSRVTLRSILDDPDLPRLIRYFRRTWIPDEAFFQTLVRKHSWNVESRSLTWARFDRGGHPLTFYDDHLPALTHADETVFFARKVWPGADRIYAHFLSEAGNRASGRGGRLRRLASRAQRMPAARPIGFPRRGAPPGERPYLVLYGVEQTFAGLRYNLTQNAQSVWIGDPFESDDTEHPITDGGLSASVAIARANPSAYLANLLRGHSARPVLSLKPGAPADAARAIAADRYAQVVIVEGGWCLSMARDLDASEQAFAAAQSAESLLLASFASGDCRASVHRWSLGAALVHSGRVLEAMGLPADSLYPQATSGLHQFVLRMRDAGLDPSVSLEDSLWADGEDATWSEGSSAVRVAR